jgi:hypothetical protein
VFDARIGQQALVVALGQHERRCHGERQQPEDEEHPAHETRPERGVTDRCEGAASAYRATDSSTPDMSPETGAGAWLCASGSQLCIGARPALVAKPRVAKAIPEAGHRRIEAPGARDEVTNERVGCPAAGSRHTGDDAEEGDGDADRAEDDVLPRSLQRASSASVADEERGGDRRRLDGHPEDTEVVGEHCQAHRRRGTGTPGR